MKSSPYTFHQSAAFYALLLVLFLMYIPQYLFHWYFIDYFSFLYSGNEEITSYPFIFLALLVLLVFVVVNLIPRIHSTVKFKNTPILSTLKHVFFISFIVVFLITAVKFSLDYGIDFRHHNRLSEAGFIVTLMFFLRFAAVFYVFYIFAKFLREGKVDLNARLGLLAITFGLSLVLTSSLSIPVVILAAVLAILPQNKLRALLLKGSKLSTFKLLLVPVLLIPSVFAVLFMGFANKWGVQAAFDFFSDSGNWMLLASKIFTRLSTSYASVNAFMNSNHLFDLNYQIDAFYSGVQTFISRLGMVSGLYAYNLDGIESVNRMNFESLFNTYLPRAGTSPGPVASALYIPFFPLNFLVMAMYIAFILRLLERYVPVKQSELSLFSKLFLAYFLLPFLESPLNLLSIINPVVMYVVLFIVVAFFINPKRVQDNLKYGLAKKVSDYGVK